MVDGGCRMSDVGRTCAPNAEFVQLALFGAPLSIELALPRHLYIATASSPAELGLG
jgi:hypothetical protein